MAGYEVRLDPAFEGVFSMSFDAGDPYTHKSQYLRQVTLTGTNPSSLVGNEADNLLRGNGADNTLDGRGGEDTVIYCGNRADYTLTLDGDELTVTGPDGDDLLRSVEVVHFLDDLVSVASL